MESAPTVDVVEQCRISPPAGWVSPALSLPLTFLDIPWLFQHSVPHLILYEVPHSNTHFFNTIVPDLKHSLSLTLQHFFPLAGSLTWPDNSTKPVILCTQGDSISLTVAVAESHYDFSQLTGNHPRDINLFYSLIPELNNTSTPDIKAFPVLALKVTLFPNKGICIGSHCHHVVADGKILIHFINCWASVCRNNHDTSCIGKPLLPFYDRSSIKDPNGTDVIMLNRFNITKESLDITNKHVFPIQDKFLATLVMRPRDVKKIRQWVLTRFQKEQNETPSLHLSTFVITCAYVWVCTVKAQSGITTVNADDDPMLEYFFFPIDCRAKRKPPLPEFYFGNCVGRGTVEIKRSDLIGEDGIAIAAKLIGNAVIKGDDGDADETLKNLGIFSNKDWLFAIARGGVLAVAGSTKFGSYETNFGWGCPEKSEVISIASTGAMFLSECPNEVGAVEIGMARSKKEIDAFTTLFISNLEVFPDCVD